MRALRSKTLLAGATLTLGAAALLTTATAQASDHGSATKGAPAPRATSTAPVASTGSTGSTTMPAQPIPAGAVVQYCGTVATSPSRPGGDGLPVVASDGGGAGVTFVLDGAPSSVVPVEVVGGSATVAKTDAAQAAPSVLGTKDKHGKHGTKGKHGTRGAHGTKGVPVAQGTVVASIPVQVSGDGLAVVMDDCSSAPAAAH